MTKVIYFRYFFNYLCQYLIIAKIAESTKNVKSIKDDKMSGGIYANVIFQF